MITDRTQTDVDNAIYLRKTKVQKLHPLTSTEVETMERGTITINTLNRIESKQTELKQLFHNMGYWNTDISNRTWGYSDIFNFDNFSQIIDNLNVLKSAFFVYDDTPKTPPVSYCYYDINDIEKILVDLDVMINDVKSNYRECGMFECGEA